MNSRNSYFPTREDIFKWAFSDEKKWPASDWDYYVMHSVDNDIAIVGLAGDSKCKKRDFFLHSLYYFVGNAFNSGCSSSERKRIAIMLDEASKSQNRDLLRWSIETNELLDGKLDFDADHWLHHMFS